MKSPSLNRMALPLVEELVEGADRYGIEVVEMGSGATLLDLGVKAPGGVAAGLRMVEICLAGLGRASLSWSRLAGLDFPAVAVWVDAPALAALGSQMAGWKLSLVGRTALGSGPARALARKPKKIFRVLGHEEESDVAILALEADALPGDDLAREVADACGVRPSDLYILVSPINSMAGMVQVVGRMVEACLLKMLNMGLDVNAVRSAMGLAFLPPLHPDPDVCMGRANDSLLYGSSVWLTAEMDDEVLAEKTRKLPSSSSPSYGKPFLTIYEEAGRDFYSIDPSIFAPARVVITSLSSGRTYVAGGINERILTMSFGLRA